MMANPAAFPRLVLFIRVRRFSAYDENHGALTFGLAEERACRFVAIDSDSPAGRSVQQIPPQLVPPWRI